MSLFLFQRDFEVPPDFPARLESVKGLLDDLSPADWDNFCLSRNFSKSSPVFTVVFFPTTSHF